MNEIMKKTYELIDVLEGSDLIQELEVYRSRIMSNQELVKVVEKGRKVNDEYMMLDIKRRLYQNTDYKNYIDKYNQLMYLVMDINYRYSKILSKGRCHK